MTLFQHGSFLSSSGVNLDWKIECDSLTDADIECLAKISLQMLRRLSVDADNFIGVPRGGVRLADAMQRLKGERGDKKLVVDDVLTTGSNMKRMMAAENADLGLVIFARRPCPIGIYYLFETNWYLDVEHGFLPNQQISDSEDGW